MIIRSSDSINIALYGGWGVGKSTTINFLKNRLPNKEKLKNYQLIIVDAWKLTPEILRQELLEEPSNKLGIKESKIKKYGDGLGQFTKKLQPLVKQLKVNKLLVGKCDGCP